MSAETAVVIADRISKARNADILLINSSFDTGVIDQNLINALIGRNKKENVFVILVTSGGDAAAAYRVGRALQRCYKKITMYISGWCKSAGTLCALAAHELVIGEFGELGPLDVQIRKTDELGESSSGLVVSESLKRLQDHCFDMFQGHMLQIKQRSGGAVSFKLAAEIAAKISVGLLEPLYRQIDPVSIGDLGRAMSIARDYGMRLIATSDNITEDNLDSLIEMYPSHDFVIDHREAKALFNNVLQPTEDEINLALALNQFTRFPTTQKFCGFLDNSQDDPKSQEGSNDGDEHEIADDSENQDPGKPPTDSNGADIARKSGESSNAGNHGGSEAA